MRKSEANWFRIVAVLTWAGFGKAEGMRVKASCCGKRKGL